jgi:hypothetical protein
VDRDATSWQADAAGRAAGDPCTCRPLSWLGHRPSCCAHGRDRSRSSWLCTYLAVQAQKLPISLAARIRATHAPLWTLGARPWCLARAERPSGPAVPSRAATFRPRCCRFFGGRWWGGGIGRLGGRSMLHRDRWVRLTWCWARCFWPARRAACNDIVAGREDSRSLPADGQAWLVDLTWWCCLRR